MINFFGSVMETIHTDSAYKAPSTKTYVRADIKLSPDKPVTDDQSKTTTNSDGLDRNSDRKPSVTTSPLSLFRIYLHDLALLQHFY